MCVDKNLFATKNINSMYICPIGKGVITKAVGLSCEGSNNKNYLHIFCKDCIIKSLMIIGSCPLCRQQKTIKDLILIPSYSSIINNFKLKCENSDKNCKWEGKYEDYENHKNSCQYEELKCPNINCGKNIIRKDLHEHNGNCEYRNIECELCNGYYAFKFKDKHLSKEKCNKCDIEYNKCCKDKHSINDCCDRLIACPDCNENYMYKNENEHHINCEHKIITCCIDGCHEQFKRNQMQEHNNIYQSQHMQILINEMKKLKEDIQKMQSNINK